MKILALIPARGGSKGVPRKNIKILGGRPLIEYTIEAAKKSGVFTDIFVSTDDLEIAEVAKKNGIDVPYLRPIELSNDTAPMLEVIEHVIKYYKHINIEFDAICLLQPTCPFRTEKQIIDSVEIFKKGEFDSLISVLEVPQKYNPHWVFKPNEDNHLKLFSGELQPISRRQDLPKAYIREGSIYLFKTSTLTKFKNIYGEKISFILIDKETVNIDTMEDFEKAEIIVKNIIK